MVQNAFPHWPQVSQEPTRNRRLREEQLDLRVAGEPWHRWLLRRIDPFLAHFVRLGTALLALFLFRVLNRTRVIGKRRLPSGPRVLLMPNHISLIDPFLVASTLYYPRLLTDPGASPHFPAAYEYFHKTRARRWFARRWRCIPVQRGQRDFGALYTMISRLRDGNMILFPEGTRSRTGDLGPGRIGTGKLIYDVKPTVVPIYIHGLEQVLPVGARFPRLGREIRLYVGEPLDLSPLYALPPGKETSRMVVDQVIRAIATMRSRVTGEPVAELLRPGREARLREAESRCGTAAA